MGLRTIFLIVLATLILSTPVIAETKVESHPYFLALVAAEKCEGQRATLIEELRLAQVLSRETGKQISSEDIRAALDQRRAEPSGCQAQAHQEVLNLYKTTVHPLLQEPILRGPASLG